MKGKKGTKRSKEYIPQLGARLKQVREAKGYTSYEVFAYEHNINRTQYGRYERGEDLRFSTLLRVITALGVTVNEFFEEGFE
jgi:transcriptional regulator with XRE-family HTH domain